MTPSELKANVQSNNTESHYFTRGTMKFFGDTMANYGVRSAVVLSNYDADGNWIGTDGQSEPVQVEVWELYRKRAVKHGLKDSVYFDKATFKRVYPVKETA